MFKPLRSLNQVTHCVIMLVFIKVCGAEGRHSFVLVSLVPSLVLAFVVVPPQWVVFFHHNVVVVAEKKTTNKKG